MDIFPEFSLIPKETQRKITVLKFFDLKYLIDIQDNFGMDPIDIDALSKKIRETIKGKTFGWGGFSAAMTKLITWSTVFAQQIDNDSESLREMLGVLPRRV